MAVLRFESLDVIKEMKHILTLRIRMATVGKDLIV